MPRRDSSRLASPVVQKDPAQPAAVSDQPDLSLDEFIHQRSRILEGKLEVLLLEVALRLRIWQYNGDRLEEQKEALAKRGRKLDHMVTTGLRDPGEVSALRQAQVGLLREDRDRSAGCWSDVTDVMRDILATWEAHEQAKARGRLLGA